MCQHQQIFGKNSDHEAPKFEYIITNDPFIMPYDKYLNIRQSALYHNTTNWPLFAKFKDGSKVTIKVKSCDAAENCAIETLPASGTFEIDNFQPYISKVEVSHGGRKIHSLDRIEASLSQENTGFLKNSIKKKSFFPLPGAEVELTVKTSEILSELKIGYSYNSEAEAPASFNMNQSVSDKLVWTYKFRPTTINIGDYYFFTFKGKDLSSNQIVDVYWNSEKNGSKIVPIPCRINHTGTEWTNVPSLLPGKDHLKVPFFICGRNNADEEDCAVLDDLKNFINYLSCNNAQIVLSAPDFDPVKFTISWSDGSGIALPQYDNKSIITGNNPGTYCYKIEAISTCCTLEGCAEVDINEILKAAMSFENKISRTCNSETRIITKINDKTNDLNLYYDLLWSDGNASNSITLNNNQEYSLTLTDKNSGCKHIEAFNTQISDIEVKEFVSQPTCGNNGIIELWIENEEFDTQINYLWSDGSTDSERYNLGPGVYCVTVTSGTVNEGDCTKTKCFTISPELSPLTITLEATNSCSQGSGTITTTITGGTAPYTYLWSNGATTQDISGLDVGIYSVTVTDSDGCSKVQSVEVLDKNIKAITFDHDFTQPVCNGSSTVIKIASVEGFLATANTLGTLNEHFTFLWSNAATISYKLHQCY